MNSNYLKSLKIVYFAMATGIVLFLLVTLLLNKFNGALAEIEVSSAQRAPFLIVLIVLTGATLMVYRAIFPKKLEAIKVLPSLSQKLAAWRELCILQGALIEAPAFFALVLFMLLGIYALLVWPLAGIFLFWISQPSRDKLVSDANLTSSETAEFDSMN